MFFQINLGSPASGDLDYTGKAVEPFYLFLFCFILVTMKLFGILKSGLCWLQSF